MYRAGGRSRDVLSKCLKSNINNKEEYGILVFPDSEHALGFKLTKEINYLEGIL